MRLEVYFFPFFLLFPLLLPAAELLAAAGASEPEANAAAAAAEVAIIPGGKGWFFLCFGTSSAILMRSARPATITWGQGLQGEE